MDKLDLDTLFPNQKKKSSLNVNNMFTPLRDPMVEKRPSRHLQPFSVDNLIQTQDRIDFQIQQTYREVYELCLEKIEQANLLRQFDLIFEIPMTLYNNPVASTDDCANYVVKHIRKNFMDGCRISPRHIFITWINIRNNKERYLKQKSNQ